MQSMWIATTGMAAQTLNMEVIANNLANVSTSGFKKSRADFQDLLYEIMKVPGSPTSADTKSPTGIQTGLGVKTAAITKVFTGGDIIQTENKLDVAVEGRGLFEVLLPDGNTAYTRAGNLKLDGEGRLTTSDGFPIQPQITIPVDATEVTISQTGVVSATVGDSTTVTQLGNLELATFINPSGLIAIGKNLFRETEASGTATVGTPGSNGVGTLLQGYVENSNVNLTEELTYMISAQRAFEVNSKVITTADQMMQTTNQMK